MSNTVTANSNRAIDVIISAFRASMIPGDGMAAPAAVLWTDDDGQWSDLVFRLRSEMPHLFTLGEYDAENRTGPAIWLRCVVDRTLPDVWPKEQSIPILYLPKVERQQLRAGGDCPVELQPLVELQFRGAVWHQRNGRDWTVEAFLTSTEGCGLEIAKDQATRSALIRMLPRLADVPLVALRGRRLTADDFDKLAVPDPQRDLLVWMHDAAAFRRGRSIAEWTAFRNLVRAGYGIDPEDDGLAAAALKLLEGHGGWAQLWQRFTEAPQRYRGISALLREPLPGQGILVDRARQPLENDDAEKRLREALVAVADLPQDEARDRVRALEGEHGERRGWVWRYLGESPLADALLHLARLADIAKGGLSGSTVSELARSYADDGWRGDDAAIAAMASAHSPAQNAIISGVLRAIYLPWLDRVARQFQDAVAAERGIMPTEVTAAAEPGTCLVFADGLRFDLAARLKATLEGESVITRLAHRIGPVPTVTATAKPLATSLTDSMEGGDVTDFTPRFVDTKQSVAAARLRDRLAARGVEIIESDEVRMPSSDSSIGWVEVGRIDELGHKLRDELAQHLEREVDRLKETVLSLLDAGWRRVRVVTDHGWLLMPGGLPKIELPQYVVASRWARCATVRENATPQVTTNPWYWNANVRVATPPGVGAYVAGTAYTHGGISPQECVVPELTCERGAAALIAKITAVEWKRLRCVVTVSTIDPMVRVDVRSSWKLPATTLVVAPKNVGDTGQANLAVRDDCEGQAVSVVLIDQNENVLDKQTTIAGGD